MRAAACDPAHTQTGIFVSPRADEISGSSVHAELNGVRIFL
jgi:hypothetical protein